LRENFKNEKMKMKQPSIIWRHRFTILSVLLSFALHTLVTIASRNEKSNSSNDGNIVLQFKKVGGHACPYAASWLAAVNLFSKAHWYAVPKMEVATEEIFRRARLKFQLADHDAFYVHHMSMYEHFNHRVVGQEIAHHRAEIMSEAAVAGECSNLTVNDSEDFMSLIPFYGGLPPTVNGTVNKLGEGNSLVRKRLPEYIAHNFNV
jgi:hypothetical protein